jgi:hypothetical protein
MVENSVVYKIAQHVWLYKFYLGIETGGPSYEAGNNQGKYHQLENILTIISINNK